MALVLASRRLYCPSLPCAALPALPVVPILLEDLQPLVSLVVSPIHCFIHVSIWHIKISCAAQWITKSSFWNKLCGSSRALISSWCFPPLGHSEPVQRPGQFHQEGPPKEDGNTEGSTADQSSLLTLINIQLFSTLIYLSGNVKSVDAVIEPWDH